MSGPATRRLARLRDRLARRIAIREERVALPRAGRCYDLLVPADQDRLLDEAETDPEQQLPYWAEVWPSGLALADFVLERGEALGGRAVLELGCGLGITAAAAVEAGARLLATDYSPVALDLTRYNVLRNTGREPRARQLNWRQPLDELLARVAARQGYPLVLAADVLYEERDIAPLLTLASALLARDGQFWLAEPGRESARRWLVAMVERGWRDTPYAYDGPWPDGRVTVTVHRLQPPGD